MSFNGVVPAESCLSKIPPLQNPVFIADLHLAADKPATKEAFFKFLKNDAARFSGPEFEEVSENDELGETSGVVFEIGRASCRERVY